MSSVKPTVTFWALQCVYIYECVQKRVVACFQTESPTIPLTLIYTCCFSQLMWNLCPLLRIGDGLLICLDQQSVVEVMPCKALRGLANSTLFFFIA
jgi:hypothetical protein